MQNSIGGNGVLARGQQVLLRDAQPSDAERYLHWQTHGEWRAYDAPWETDLPLTTEDETQEFIARFIARCEQEHPVPRQRATIATPDDRPLGWVIRYAHDRFPDVTYIGIDICEDAFLNRGLGTEALGLWVDYLFETSDFCRISLDTWSLNPRMMRVAEKLGFSYEGAQREMIAWQGKRLDWVHYGLLRDEWRPARTGTR